MFKYELSVIET